MTEPKPLSELVGHDLADAVTLYQSFMEEIKTRLTAMKETIDDLKANPAQANGYLKAEFAYLQLRYVCELTALAVLAAHRPYGLSETLLDSYHARRAFADLAKQNPQCFPRRVTFERTENKIQLTFNDENILNRGGLTRIYNKLGSALHRGPLKHILEKGKVYDMNLLERWARRIGTLLSHHVLMILDEGLVLITHLTGGPGGSVQVAISQSDGPAVLIPKPAAPSPPPRRPKGRSGPRTKRRK